MLHKAPDLVHAALAREIDLISYSPQTRNKIRENNQIKVALMTAIFKQIQHETE